MHHLTTQRGINWHYEILGDGEPVLFLHGWGGDLRLWGQQFEHFSKNHTVLSVDLPGHGKTSWTSLDLRGFADDLKELLDRIGVGRVNIVASSLGGLLALKYYSLFPKTVRRLILIGALPKFSMEANYPFGLEAARIQKLGEQLKSDYPAIVSIFFRSLFTQREREGARFQWLEQFRNSEQLPKKEALSEFLIMLKDEDLREVLKSIQIPVQIINGSDDYICSTESVDYLKSEIPTAQVVLFKGCGHFPFISQPQEFNKVLENFLQEDPSNCEFPKETIYDFTRLP